MDVSEIVWMFARADVESHEYLSKAGEWGLIPHAAEFSDKAGADAAVVPAGTDGRAVEMDFRRHEPG